MKSFILLAALVFSANSFALEVFGSTSHVTETTVSFSDITTNGLNICKEAALVINNANEFYATGEASPALAARIKAVQVNSDVSVEEAVSVLVDAATEILNANK